MADDTLSSRARRFVRWGFLAGAGFSLLLLPWLALTGNRPLPRFGLTPLAVAAVYVLAGTIGGMLVALLYPLRRWFLGAFLLGVVTLFPVYTGFALLLRGDAPLSVGWVLGGVLAFFVGGGLGTQIWTEEGAQAAASPRTVMVLWIVTAACQVPGWYLGLRWPGESRAAVGLALVFLPPFVAALATISRARRSA